MHIGTVRTALFNYLFAKQHGGTYFVRIEDTDKARNKPEWVDAIWRDFEWCGILPDQRYVQSAHLARHRELLHGLVAAGNAYESEEPAKDDPSRTVRVIRLRNAGNDLTFDDLVRGEVTFNTAELGDFVIARSIDDPLYHFAVVADDADAGVTHVIRAEEHLSNTPRQILIQEALGFPRPLYAHIPLILAPDRSKLSKRHGAVSVEEFRDAGFVPEALINYLALLGWNPGTDQELFSLPELVSAFKIEQVQKAGAIFDMEKFRWFDHAHLLHMPDDAFAARYRDFAGESPAPALIPLLKERARTLGEAKALVEGGEFSFMADTLSYERSLLLKGAKTDAATAGAHLAAVATLLESITEFDAESVKDAVFPYATEKGRGAVLWPLRVALSGRERSPDPFVIAALIGKEKTLARIKNAQALLVSL